jgi:thiol:disulfide interchange protein
VSCPLCKLSSSSPLGFILVLAAAVVLIRTITGGGVAATPPMFEEQFTLQQALDRSSESGKPVFAFATADWCGPCQSFKRGALSDDRVIDAALSSTVPVYIDIDKDPEARQQAAAFAGLDDINSVPTILLIQDGEVIGYHAGVMSTSAMLKWLAKANDS